MNSYIYCMITNKPTNTSRYKKIDEYVVLGNYVESVYIDTITNEKYYRGSEEMMVTYNPILDNPPLDILQIKEQYPEVLI